MQQLGVVAERLQGVEQSLVLRQGGEHQARVLESAGESLVKTAAQQLDAKAREFARACGNLAAYTKSAYDRKSQDARMWMAAGFGVIAGILLTLFLPRFLPFSADTHVASLVMGQDRWNAGITMMRAENLQATNVLADADRLYRDNAEAIGKCREAAAKAGKEQKWTVMVAVPQR